MERLAKKNRETFPLSIFGEGLGMRSQMKKLLRGIGATIPFPILTLPSPKERVFISPSPLEKVPEGRMRTKEGLGMRLILFISLILFCEKSFAQNCLNPAAQYQLNSMLFLNNDYDTAWKKTISLTQGNATTVNLETENDYQYIIILVCNSTVKGCGLELQDASGTRMDYVVNYSPPGNYYATIEFDCDLGGDYKILCTASPASCAQLVLLSRENEAALEKTKLKY